MSEKVEAIQEVQAMVVARDAKISDLEKRLAELSGERVRMRADYSRLRAEAQEKIDKLMERFKELNQRLVGDEKKGMFR
jgi:molecular chaperone GrpE (heat shock protein)